MVTTTGWILVVLPVGLIVYSYVVYPALLWILAVGRTRPVVAAPAYPLVSIVIPAYNEERQIRGAIEAMIGQNYPADRRQILIISDASTDGTDQVVAEYATHGVELLRMATRSGKTGAENASCALLRGEIIVNSDASIRMHPSAVRRLVEAMADPRVGVASTRDVSVERESATAVNVAEAGYVGYEMRIRALETATGGIVGASGSGYAIRSHLHRIPIRGDLSRDFSAALTARIYGYRAVSVEDAICFVPRTTSLRVEYRRKVRTVARGAETLLHNRFLLDPSRFGSFAWKLWSHKVCRWLVPASALPGVAGLLILAPEHPWAAVTLGVLLIGTLAVAAGALWPPSKQMPRIISILTFATSANVAVVHALLRVIVGHDDHVWEPTRRTHAEAGS
jgi:cellulose synthase/poly-beta-1,6-N-acetylglucosamine synthase-like glycosyltransferase